MRENMRLKAGRKKRVVNTITTAAPLLTYTAVSLSPTGGFCINMKFSDNKK